MRKTVSTSRHRPVRIQVELIRPEGQDDAILTAITALQTVLVRRIERLEKKIDALVIDQQKLLALDRESAGLEAAIQADTTQNKGE